MSISDKITRLTTARNSIRTAINNKGGSASSHGFEDFASDISDISTKEDITWHQCPQLVKDYLAAADYSSDTSYNTSIISNYATGLTDYSNTKPIAETVSGDLHRNEVPNVYTPYASSTKAGALKPLDTLKWINTTSLTWVDGVNAFASDADAQTYVNAHPDTPNRTLFRIYPTPAEEHIPNNRKFVIYEDGELKLFSYYDVGYNVRDLGGWACDGGTIKYGMLVRGGDTNPADEDLMVNQIGIRTEVRLFETSAQGLDHSVWDIDMIVNPTNSVIASSMDDEMWKPLLKGIFNSVANNRPVYFHCGQGADRTGAMAVMLEAILGVSENNISKDYELTSFSKALRERNSNGFKTIINNIKGVSLVGGLTDTFRNRAISFVASLGITDKQINDFRNACINGTPEKITTRYNLSQYLTNCTSSATDGAVWKNSSLNITLSPTAQYNLTSVTVWMGGVDVTSTVYSGGVISIPTVNGDVEVTAEATIAGRIPPQYQEVEWIGEYSVYHLRTLCIKPNLTWNDFDKVEFIGYNDAETDSNVGSQGIMILATYTGTDARTSPYMAFRDSKTPHAFFNGVTGTCDQNYTKAELRTSDYKPFTLTLTSNSNNGQVAFGSWQDSNFGNKWRTKEQKWYLGSTLVRHLVPCYRIADNVIGMYDIIGGGFYTASDTNSSQYLIKGSSV